MARRSVSKAKHAAVLSPPDPVSAPLDARRRVLVDRPGGAVLVITATPKAGANMVGPVEGDAVRVRVTTAAVDGAANAAIVKLLAASADLPRSRVRIVAGHCARRKRVQFEGILATELAQRLTLDRSPSQAELATVRHDASIE